MLLTVGGLLAGYLAWRTGARAFQARTAIFVTQSGGLAQPGSLAAIARSRSVLASVAHRTHLSVEGLGAGLSATPVGSTPTPGVLYFQISVRGPRRRASVEASRLIAAALLDRIGDYQAAQVASAKTQLIEARQELAAARQRAVLARSLPPANLAVRITALGLIEQAQGIALSRISNLQTQLAEAKAQKSQVISTSVTPVGIRSAAASAIVGAAIGLILAVLGCLALPDSASRPRAP